MNKKSAGILLYRIKENSTEVMLVHPGGPFWKNKDAGAWSIPKGEFAADEEPLTAALREFKEELGTDVEGSFFALTPVRLKSGKQVLAFAAAHDFDIDNFTSNTFLMKWPPKSGKQIEVPEIDKAAWFDTAIAKEKINPAQAAFIDELLVLLAEEK